jgi:DUF1680 family protein
MVTYFLPLQPGARKKWGTPTEDFWCCHGTLVQAQTMYSRGCYYQTADGLAVTQYLPSQATWEWQDAHVTFILKADPQTGAVHQPRDLTVTISVKCDKPTSFALKLRVPWWVKAAPTIEVNGVPEYGSLQPASFHTIQRTWQDDTLHIVLPKGLWTDSLPDQADTVAFMDGPVVLAGLTDEERLLYGDKAAPGTLLAPDNEREWGNWISSYRTVGQPRGLRFIPLYEVRDEKYSVYFPLAGRTV